MAHERLDAESGAPRASAIANARNNSNCCHGLMGPTSVSDRTRSTASGSPRSIARIDSYAVADFR